MKQQLTTLGKVFDRVDEMSAGCYDQNIDVPDISFDNLDVLRIAGEPHPVVLWHSDQFQTALAFRIRICAGVHPMCRR
jgi:hypothetical protein